jgi:autotransporter translocation and assembly factor TamB
MSPQPGRIVAEVAVDARRPRSLNTGDTTFGAAADEVRRALTVAQPREAAA